MPGTPEEEKTVKLSRPEAGFGPRAPLCGCIIRLNRTELGPRLQLQLPGLGQLNVPYHLLPPCGVRCKKRERSYHIQIMTHACIASEPGNQH